MNHSKSENSAIWFVLFLSFLFIVLTFVLSEYQILQIKNNLVNKSPAITTTIPTQQTQISSDCGVNCQAYINEAVRQALATQSGTPKASSTPTLAPLTISQNPPKTTQITYIPLSGGSTQNTDWINIAGTQFTLNISDYGSNAYPVWDANLRVDNANGTTYARLFDTTHSIAVNGSEISITSTSTSTDVISGRLSFWAGNNNYVIQAKSLNGSTAFIDSGRIKISY